LIKATVSATARAAVERIEDGFNFPSRETIARLYARAWNDAGGAAAVDFRPHIKAAVLGLVAAGARRAIERIEADEKRARLARCYGYL